MVAPYPDIFSPALCARPRYARVKGRVSPYLFGGPRRDTVRSDGIRAYAWEH
jgi:hypothetical protein